LITFAEPAADWRVAPVRAGEASKYAARAPASLAVRAEARRGVQGPAARSFAAPGQATD
jgi:hypothetical protein